MVDFNDYSKFSLKKIAFNENGKLNKHLDEADIIKCFEKVINMPHDDEEKSMELEKRYWKLF